MGDFRRELQVLKSERKGNLERQLQELLHEPYDSAVRGSLNHEFMEGCCYRIAPEENPMEYVQQWHNYSPSWKRKKGKSLATALRMLLTEQIGLPRYEVIDGFKIRVLAEIITGIRGSDNGVERSEGAHVPVTLPPDIPVPVGDPPERSEVAESLFEEIIRLSDVSELVPGSEPRSDKFAVYTLDCTAPAEEERKALWQLRRDAWAKDQSGYSLRPKEEAAQALTRGERVYYIGQTKDVFDRMERHRKGASAGSARFTNIFRPKGVVEVSWCDSEQEAKVYERQRAAELTVEGQSFAYFN